jgi:hypothetical protein
LPQSSAAHDGGSVPATHGVNWKGKFDHITPIVFAP